MKISTLYKLHLEIGLSVSTIRPPEFRLCNTLGPAPQKIHKTIINTCVDSQNVKHWINNLSGRHIDNEEKP